MRVDPSVLEAVEASSEGRHLTRCQCIRFLSFDEGSPEADLIRDTADVMSRRLSGNSCSIGVQIGVITGPCIADCGFCGFACSTTDADDYIMPSRVLREYLEHVTEHGDVESVSLMTIHNFDFDDLMGAVDTAVETVPRDVTVCVNTGDLTATELRELRDAGVRRAYHAVRVGEGDDTRLSPMDRFGTIRLMRDAGIDPVSCVEPIGPEHTAEDIVDRFMQTREAGCSRCSASRRLDVPGTRMHGMGEISESRLAQIRSVLFLSTGGDGFYGGYYGGLGMEFAEYAGSPKDTADYSERHNGNTVEAVRRRLLSEGYEWIRTGDGGRIRLDAGHLDRTHSR